MNILKNIKITRLLNAVAAGTSNQTGSTLDMSGWDGVVFIASFGALTATAVTGLKAQQDTASGMGGAADLAGSLVSVPDTDSNKVAVLDIFRPLERYVRPIVTRGTANAVIDGVIAIQYKGSKRPSTQDSSVTAASKTLASPAEGTA